MGPPELYAWLHYDPIPTRDDLAKALIAYFTGHLGISTTMRAHEGIGTAQSHLTVSTAPMTVSVSFHEPVRWDGWILYTHESTQVGAGMSYGSVIRFGRPHDVFAHEPPHARGLARYTRRR